VHLHESHQAGHVIDHQMVLVALVIPDADAAYRGRHPLREMLLEERRPGVAARAAHHREGAPGDVWEDPLCDGDVVARQLRLGDLQLGPQDTLRMAHVDAWDLPRVGGVPGGPAGGARVTLAHDLARRLVVTKADEHRMTEPSVAGPVGEGDL